MSATDAATRSRSLRTTDLEDMLLAGRGGDPMNTTDDFLPNAQGDF
jgi:hypothetical protein